MGIIPHALRPFWQVTKGSFFEEIPSDKSLVNLAGGRNYDFADWSTQKGLELMENYLQKYPEIHAVFCQDDDVMTGVLQAIKESGRKDIKLVFGGAGSKAAYEKIIAGDSLISIQPVLQSL